MNDIRFALRSLRRSPTLAIAVVLTLALCIGATSAVFSVVYAVLFRPLPFKDPGGLILFTEVWKDRPGGSVSVGNWADARREDHLFEHLVPMSGASVNLAGATTVGGRLPINASGGLLSRGHPGAATGAAQLVELVWQLQGRAGKRQVENARVGIAHSAGGRIGDETACTAISVLQAGA